MARFLLAAAAACFVSALAAPPPAAAMQLPQLEEKDLPPSLVSDSFSYGKDRHDRVFRIVNPIEGRPPVIVTVPDQEDFTHGSRYEEAWLDHYFFDHKWLPMSVAPDGNGHRGGAEHIAAVAAGIGEIVRRAPRLGYDPDRIVLVGSGWGGQVAALLATDPAWLAAEGVPLSSIRAVLILDGFGLDLEAEMEAADPRLRKEIGRMLGEDAPTRLSPLRHAAAPNAPRFLFYVPTDAPQAAARTEAVAAALRSGGSEAEVKRVRRTRKDVWPTYPGNPRHPEKEALARFLREALAKP
jgi:dienelactone hydrolase